MNKLPSKLFFVLSIVFFSINGVTAKIVTTETSLGASSSAERSIKETAILRNDATQRNAPRTLILDLYRMHDEDLKNSDERILSSENRKNLDKYFDKTLADYMWKDLTTHKDEVGVLDFDPFYNAQEFDIKKLNVGQPKISGDKATLVVTFENFSKKETLTYKLIRRKATWKISDIGYAENQSLLGYFKEDEKASKNK